MICEHCNKQIDAIPIWVIEEKIQELEEDNERAKAYAMDTTHIHFATFIAVDNLRKLINENTDKTLQ